ncbi:CHAT domain-containing protein [Micromonospora sp. KLBMP9576]|uniref:CHAT domain-containing protein n=1 Tax=Micromonospora sp. KLBMP9576 TaxID=3424769 RepID=UPI003D92C60A
MPDPQGVARARAAAATLRSCITITETTVAAANELLDSILALPDLAGATEELAALAEFYLRFSDAVAGDDPGLAGHVHESALDVLTCLAAYDIHRVPRVFVSRVRMLVLNDQTDRHLPALEALAELATSQCRPDQEVLLRIGELRWSRFLNTSGDAALRELLACTTAYESAAELGELAAPDEIVDYLTHLRPHADPPEILLRGWIQRGYQPPGATGRQVIILRSQFQPRNHLLLAELAGCHLTRFKHSGHPDDLEAAVSIAAPLIESGASPDAMLWARLTLMGALVLQDDIEQASRLLQETITGYGDNVPMQLRQEWFTTVSLIAALTEDPRVINAAAVQLQSAIAETGHRDPATAPLWFQLASTWQRRFKLTGHLPDLTKAIRDARVATRLDPRTPAPRECLAFWLFDRHQLTGNVEDKRASAELLRTLQVERALSPHAIDHSMKILLSTSPLGPEALTELADSFRRTTRETADSRSWFFLALTLTRLNETTENHRHDDEAIDAARHALTAATTSTGADELIRDMRGLLAKNLGRRGRPADASEAISLLRGLVETEARPTAANLHRIRLAALLLKNRVGHHDVAFDLLRRVADDPAAPATDRTDAAYLLAQAAAAAGEHAIAADSYRTTVDLLAREARKPLYPAERREQKRRWFGAAEDGAACALAANRPETALALLEQGRGIQIGQTLQLREQLRWLRAHRPELAEEMAQLLDAIQAYRKGTNGEIPRDFIEAFVPVLAIVRERVRALQNSFDLTAFSSVEALFEENERLANEVSSEVLSEDTRYEFLARWSDFEVKVRHTVPDEPWRLPTDAPTLLAAVPDGHAVIINTSRQGCAALIIGDGRATQIELPRLTLTDINEQYRRIMLAILSVQAGDLSKDARAELAVAFTEAQAWLWDTVAEPVLSRIHPPDREPPAELPRIWWLPAGPLAVLPLHAAGRPGGPYVLDRAVSSYATTLGMLHHVRRGRRLTNGEPRLLAVAVPEIDGAAPLWHAAQELAALEPRLTRSLVGAEATINSVTALLPAHDHAHFVCHATPPVGGVPAQLHLSNGFLTVNRLGWLTPVNAELAYLSACHSANASPFDIGAGDHLAAAFQAAGYRHVIATLWAAADHVGPQVAADFYGELARAGSPARALHHAVLRLRDDYPDKPSIWASFVHFGP